jgi:hypothetical protein
MSTAVLKDPRKLGCFAVAFDTDKGLYEICATDFFANATLAPGKDPEGRDCTVLNIKWKTITALSKLKIYSGFIIYNNHIMEYLDGLNDFNMGASDSMNVTYTCNIPNDAEGAS